jgi:5-methylthioadenosine/S-adenosylhomocysteine deaminase
MRTAAQDWITCIRGGDIWTGPGEPIAAGALLIKGSEIVAVLSPSAAFDDRLEVNEFVNASGCLLMPPFTDGHVHSTATLFRGTENSLPLELWSNYIVNYDRGLTQEGLKIASQVTDIEMIRNGIGGYIDHYPQSDLADIGIKAHAEAGLRVGVAPYFADMWDEDISEIPIDRRVFNKLMPAASKTPEAVRSQFHELAAEVSQIGRNTVSLLLGPNSPQRCSDGFWKVWRELQEDLNLGTHTHLLETVPQAVAARKRWPNGLVDALDKMGLLHDRLSVGHGIWLTEAEKRIFADRGVTISYNPVSNYMLGSGRKNVRADLDLGVKIALGTDCSNSGGRHDLFEVMRHMLFSGRDPGTDFSRWISPEEVLDAATQGASAVLGSSKKLGRLAVGAAADILMLDFGKGGLVAAPVSLNSVVTQADPRNVNSLMVNGRWLLRAGKICSLDEEAIMSRAKTLASDVRAAAVEFADEIRELHTPFLGWYRGIASRGCCPTCGQSAVLSESQFSCEIL